MLNDVINRQTAEVKLVLRRQTIDSDGLHLVVVGIEPIVVSRVTQGALLDAIATARGR